MIRKLSSFGSLAAVIVVAAAYIYSLGISGVGIGDTRTATAHISHSNGLVVGSRVLMRGIAIGQVTHLSATLAGVTVTMTYDDSQRVPADSGFTVNNLSALGETFVNIVPGTADSPALPDRAVIADAAVTVPTTIDVTAGRLVELLDQVQSDDVRTIVSALNTGLIDQPDVLTNITRASALMQAVILATRVPLDRLLATMQPLIARGASVSDFLTSAGDPFVRFGTTFKAFLDTCVKFIVESNLPAGLSVGAGPFLTKVLALLDKSGPDIKALGDLAEPSVQAAAAQLSTVDLGAFMRMALAASGDGNGVVVHVGGGR